MANVLQRLDALELDTDAEAISRRSTRHICQYLSHLSMADLRREVEIAGVDFADTVAEIRFHVPIYGSEEH